MNLHLSVLDNVSKIARSFLWGSFGSNHGLHSVGWNVTTLDKSDGGLGLRNLRLVNHSLMAKNIFDILNSVNKLWVDIFKLKYHGWHAWNLANVSQSSWFYKSICNSANFIKPNLRILSCNPTSIDFLHDPCILDLPLFKKPTFLNMSVDLEALLG